ncbi:MAG TPA: PadR family transcriptional regulator [Micromonosporaceae bacterium]|nr:PadR family transcriptional regulator [Micromonosporaceae bacterium]HCU50714.1 PadR family transcriptional regulator [Micromonosporaceae bacterium]
MSVIGKIRAVGFPGRVTEPTLDVLEVLIRSYVDGVEIHGWAVTKAIGRSGPTVYGVLDRLEDMSWISGRWDDAVVEGTPRRRLYQLTPDGFAATRSLLMERRPARQVSATATKVQRPWPVLDVARGATL